MLWRTGPALIASIQGNEFRHLILRTEQGHLRKVVSRFEEPQTASLSRPGFMPGRASRRHPRWGWIQSAGSKRTGRRAAVLLARANHGRWSP
ncbi:MAG: hypothetical protein ACYDC1_01275 [Limisphaerales bacterium]